MNHLYIKFLYLSHYFSKEQFFALFMAPIQWDNSYSVNNSTIDEQHKKLFRLINNFSENIDSKPGSENISKLLNGLKDYIVFHFKTEEMYLRLCNYPDFELHKKEHEQFVGEVADIERKLINGVLPNPAEIVTFFTLWIVEHVKESDGAFSEFIKDLNKD